MSKGNITYSEWSDDIYPCTNCDYVGLLYASYGLCPACGNPKVNKTGRFIYEEFSYRWFKFMTYKKFVGVHWLDLEFLDDVAINLPPSGLLS